MQEITVRGHIATGAPENSKKLYTPEILYTVKP